MLKTLNLQAIRIDAGTQSRAKINEETVQEYADLMKTGTQFPSITVFFDGTEYYLADGFHRYLAAQRAGRTSISGDVQNGTLRDAILYSLSANAAHGLRRTNEDKRKIVLIMLEDFEWSTMTVREIADHCGVSHTLVAKIKDELGMNEKTEKKPEKKEGKKDKKSLSTVYKTKEDSKKQAQVVDSEEEIEHDQGKEVIEELVKKNEELTQRLALEVMEGTPEEKQAAQSLIEELKQEINLLRMENQALAVSRDTFQSENAQLKKQVKMLQKKLKDAGIQ